MKLLAHVLSLFGCGLKARLSTVSGLKCLLYLLIQAVFFQPKGTDSFLRGKAGLNLSVQIFPGFLGPLLSHEDLLSDLHGNDGGIIKRK